jgi:hypothetical protein
MLLYDGSLFNEFFDLVPVTQDYRYKLGILALLNSLCSYIFEKFFIGWFNKYYTRREEKMKLQKQSNYFQL